MTEWEFTFVLPCEHVRERFYLWQMIVHANEGNHQTTFLDDPMEVDQPLLWGAHVDNTELLFTVVDAVVRGFPYLELTAQCETEIQFWRDGVRQSIPTVDPSIGWF